MTGRLSAAVAAGVLAAAAAIGLTATAGWLIATAAARPPLVTLTVAMVVIRTCAIARGALRYVERLTGHDAVLRHLVDLRVAVVSALARVVPAGAPELRRGDLVSRLVHDVDATVDRILRVRLPYAVSVTVGLLSTTGAMVLDAPAGAGLGITLAVAVVVAPAAAALTSARSEARVAADRGAYAATVTQTLQGAPDLAAFGATAAALARLDAADGAVARAERRGAYGRGLAAAIAAAAAGAASWWALRIGVPATHAHTLTVAVLAVLVLAPITVHDVVSPLAPAATQIPRWRAAAGRVADVATRTPVVPEPSVPAAPPDRTDLEVERATIGWPGHEPAIQNLSLAVRAGGRVMVVGRTGAGKSTLAAALQRFLVPVTGSIRIGGVEVADMTGDDVRRIVGVCAQDAYIFDRTVAENVRLGRPDATDADVDAVLRRTGLGEWLDGLPDGVHTDVGEHGVRLSGGQRQRLALARVLLADRPLVVFDEPTEHLDEASATRVMEDLLGAAAGRTVVVMSHRGHGIDAMDAVVRLG
jgi:thiol reductant ABC exporter CydC subunit